MEKLKNPVSAPALGSAVRPRATCGSRNEILALMPPQLVAKFLLDLRLASAVALGRSLGFTGVVRRHELIGRATRTLISEARALRCVEKIQADDDFSLSFGLRAFASLGRLVQKKGGDATDDHHHQQSQQKPDAPVVRASTLVHQLLLAPAPATGAFSRRVE